MSETHARILLERVGRLLERGTLVFDRDRSTVAYAFVAPIDLRDDLADIVADIAITDEEKP